MAKDTGIIFLDVSTSISEKIKTKPPIKLMSLFFIGLMVFTAFSMVAFTTQPANASPPATGDKSFLNTSFRTNYVDVQSGSSSSYPITFSEQGSVKIYGHVKDNNSNQANSTVLNQTINPAAVPASSATPFTTGGLTVAIVSSENPTDLFASGTDLTFTVTAFGGTGTYYYDFSLNSVSQVNSTSSTWSHTKAR